MKRNLSLWLGSAGIRRFAHACANLRHYGKIHGHVINPSGAPETKGTVTVVLVSRPAGPGSDKLTDIATLPVNANGEYSGEVEHGIYKIVFRTPEMSRDREADHVEGVHIVAGQDILQDIDMSRKEYIDQLPADQKKQLEELKKHNAEAFKANAVIKNLNADLKTCDQDFKDVDAAHQAAAQILGATASKADLDAKGSRDQDCEVYRNRNPHAQGHRGQARRFPALGSVSPGATRSEEVRRSGGELQEGA